MNDHGLVVRTWREPDGRWVATAEAVPAALARATVAGGELPDTRAARAARQARSWPVESSLANTEGAAVNEAVRRLLARGLEPRSAEVRAMKQEEEARRGP